MYVIYFYFKTNNRNIKPSTDLRKNKHEFNGHSLTYPPYAFDHRNEYSLANVPAENAVRSSVSLIMKFVMPGSHTFRCAVWSKY